MEYSSYLDEKIEKQGFCMFVRLGNSLSSKLMEKYKDKNPLVIYFIWSGYLENDENMKRTVEGYTLTKLHTSGHADIKTIKTVIETVKPDMIIPIPTIAPEIFPQGKSVLVPICDGQEVIV